jgi:hypothetical protein
VVDNVLKLFGRRLDGWLNGIKRCLGCMKVCEEMERFRGVRVGMIALLVGYE